MPDTSNLLGGLPPAAFLRRHWQKKPLLIRDALPDFRSFLSRKQLFALACRRGVESRLVLEKGGDHPWQVIHGPFRPADLRRLPKRHWSLLIQNVNLLLPEAAGLLRRFSFVPNWRVDDLMVSCAPPGGSVGAHLDSYDVFLLQAEGMRRWSINLGDYGEADFVEGLDLRILDDFRADEEHLVGPGDMLYLPPGVAHHGIALEDCLTFSIGFRAPSRAEALGRLIDDLPADSDRRYADPDLAAQRHAGEITPRSRAAIRALVRDAVARDRDIDRWFGRHVTQLPEGIAPVPPRRPLSEKAFAARLGRARAIRLATASRTAYIILAGKPILFVNGRDHELPATCTAFVQTLTGRGRAAVPARPRMPLLRVLHAEYKSGALAF